MKKKIILYNIIIILCTGVTVYVLLSTNNETYEFKEQFNGTIKEAKNQPQNNSDEVAVRENKQYEESISDKNDEIKNQEHKVDLDEDVSEKKEVNIKRIHEDISEREGFYTGKKEENISVFKVKNTNIISNLTVKEKATLLYIGNKLPSKEFNKLKEVLNNRNHEKAVINSYKILRDKLSDKDLDKVKDIFNKYIDLDVLERKV